MTVNYETLLKKYMRHVVDFEGTDFVHHHIHMFSDSVKFTDAEAAELRAIAANLWEEE